MEKDQGGSGQKGVAPHLAEDSKLATTESAPAAQASPAIDDPAEHNEVLHYVDRHKAQPGACVKCLREQYTSAQLTKALGCLVSSPRADQCLSQVQILLSVGADVDAETIEVAGSPNKWTVWRYVKKMRNVRA